MYGCCNCMFIYIIVQLGDNRLAFIVLCCAFTMYAPLLAYCAPISNLLRKTSGWIVDC